MTSEVVVARLAMMGGWAGEWYEERAAILEYDGGLGRDEAEAESWREVLEEEGRRAGSLEGSQGA